MPSFKYTAGCSENGCGPKNPTVSHLTLGADADVSDDGGVASAATGRDDGLLDAEVGQHVLAEDRLSVEVGRHEAAVTRHRLKHTPATLQLTSAPSLPITSPDMQIGRSKIGAIFICP